MYCAFKIKGKKLFLKKDLSRKRGISKKCQQYQSNNKTCVFGRSSFCTHYLHATADEAVYRKLMEWIFSANLWYYWLYFGSSLWMPSVSCKDESCALQYYFWSFPYLYKTDHRVTNMDKYRLWHKNRDTQTNISYNNIKKEFRIV